MTTVTVSRPSERTPSLETSSTPERVKSIDALRGFTILVMIFVNDVAGVEGTPGWMKHVEPPEADGMTFVDVVFPAFLFIVGMSIPFATQRRFERGESSLHILQHILIRTLSLLVIGVFMVNAGGASTSGSLHPMLWILLMYAGVILVWASPPRRLGIKPSTARVLHLIGGLLLVLAAFLYEHDARSGIIELRPSWWGILGIIGWAYLAAGTMYLVLRNRSAGLLGGVVLLYCVYIADASGFFAHLTWITPWVDPGSVGAHGALTLSGVVLGVMLLPQSPLGTPVSKMKWALLYSGGLVLAAILLHGAADIHRMFIINKIYATPPWCLWSAAITIWVWLAFYWLLDVRKFGLRSRGLELSGQNALLAYIMAPIFYAAFALAAVSLAVPNIYAELGGSFASGFTRSVLFALGMVWVAALLRRKGFTLKL